MVIKYEEKNYPRRLQSLNEEEINFIKKGIGESLFNKIKMGELSKRDAFKMLGKMAIKIIAPYYGDKIIIDYAKICIHKNPKNKTLETVGAGLKIFTRYFAGFTGVIYALNHTSLADKLF